MTFSVKDLTKRFCVGEHTILGWIKRGELKAINVSRQRGGRPKWRITEEALAAFELSRMPAPPEPRVRRRKKNHDPNFVKIYT
jgi:transposase